MKRTIIALALTFAAITSAHAGTVAAFKCPTSGAVIMDAGDGDNDMVISQGGKEYNWVEETIRKVVNGKISTIQGAALMNDHSQWRAIVIPSDFEDTGVVQLVRSDKEGMERCVLTDFKTY